MPESRAFRELLVLVRAGDEQAAAELVRRYEPAIRRVIRIRLRDARLRRQFDSGDICQSVLASFFTRAALGQFDLESPDAILRLLTAMARNKLATAVEREQAQCRDYRRIEATDEANCPVASTEPSPASQLVLRELLERFQQRLTPEERQLVDLRADGRAWADIAEELGETAEALRKRHGRAVDRVARELGLDEVGDE
jgi:RNA polymerase sigma factor (sigma-70 family)